MALLCNVAKYLRSVTQKAGPGWGRVGGGEHETQHNRARSGTLYLLNKGLSPLSTNNKSIPFIYLHDTMTTAVIITARNSLHTILNFQFFEELLPQSPQNLPKKSKTS